MAHKAQNTLQDNDRAIAICHKLLQAATIVIIALFTAIIALTTLSSSPLVHLIAKAFYFAIIACVFGSLTIWGYRTYLFKRGHHAEQKDPRRSG